MEPINREETEVLSEIHIPISRENAAESIVEQLSSAKVSPPFITIHGPGGVGKSDLIHDLLPSSIHEKTRKAAPKVCRFKITPDHTSEDLILWITNCIIDNHSEFSSRRKANVFCEKMQRIARRNPEEAAERLRTMMRISEKGKFDLRKVQLIVCLDGIDKMFMQRGKSDSEVAKTPICGTKENPVEFLEKLSGIKTVLFCMTYRNWISKEIDQVLKKGGLKDDRRFDLALEFPEEDESRQIIDQMVSLVKEENEKEDHKAIEQLGDLLVETLHKTPAALGLMPTVFRRLFEDGKGGLSHAENCVKRHIDNDGVAGVLARKADHYFLAQSSPVKLALQEIFTRLIETDGELPVKDISMNPELWHAALDLVDERILALRGRNMKEACLKPGHKDLLFLWHRTVQWSESDRIVGLKQLRYFDDRALSWELGERQKNGLLHSQESLNDARAILNDSELSSQLTPLTREFLTTSLNPKVDFKKILVRTVLPVGAGVAGFLMIGGLVFLLKPKVEELPALVEEIKKAEAEKQVVTQVETPTPEPTRVEPERIEADEAERQALIEEANRIMARDRERREAITRGTSYPAETPEHEEASTESNTEETSAPLAGKADDDSVFVAPAGSLDSLPEVEEKVSGKPVPIEGLESATGHIENPNLLEEQQHHNASHYIIKHDSASNDTDIKWSEILDLMDKSLIRANQDGFFHGLAQFHLKTLNAPEETNLLSGKSFKKLIAILGTAAYEQKDREAMQAAWKLEYSSLDFETENTRIRLLMARIALNHGLDEEAVAYLAGVGPEISIDAKAIQTTKTTVLQHFSGLRTEAHYDSTSGRNESDRIASY